MTKGQKRLAAIVLGLMGIYGTILAWGDRVQMNQQAALQSDAAIETTVETTAESK